MTTVTPEVLRSAYSQGWFPMAERRHGMELRWFSPDLRGVLPLATFHIPRTLRKFLRSCPYTVTANAAFREVIRACANIPRRHEAGTWINEEIITAYTALHEAGDAHSVECWREGVLVGGLYGVSLGGAFFGESMFSCAENASKVALVVLIAILREAGYTLLDTQYVNTHLAPFGAVSIAREDYLAALENALNVLPNPSSRFSAAAGIMLSGSAAPESWIPSSAAT
jgi:leucyl/phenylalanyl-tRNA--protein transferase